MSVTSILHRSSYFVALAAILAGCAVAPQPGVGRSPMGDKVTAARQHAVLYVANYFNGNVQIYSLPGLVNTGFIQGFAHPQGVAVDSAGDVYVVDQDKNEVLVYHKGAMTPFKRLTDRNGIAFQVAVGRDGTVYLTNEFNNQLGPGNVNEYAHGSTKPTRTIRDGRFNTVEGVGLDSKNNLYVTYDDNHVVGHIEEFLSGSKIGTILRPTLKAAGGITFDAADDLVVCDQTAPAVKIFAQGSGTPKGQFAQGQIDPFNLSLTKDEGQIFVTDPRSGNTYEYAFPSGSRLHTIVGSPGATGVAVGHQ